MRRRRTTAGEFGDPAGHRALEALYTAHADRVLAYLLHRTDRETAQDILSETFVLAWRKSGSVPDDALPWLLASARRLLANRVRSDQRHHALTARLAVMADRPETSEIADTIGARAEVAAALSALSEQDREVLVLSAWYGLTARQAAVVLGCTAPTFAVRLHRARKRFRAALPPPVHVQQTRGALPQSHLTHRESA
ncbi:MULTISPECIES: RNA polymerase sigma factor [Streptomyces]|uniref:Putative sigma factor n=1 Tax=Streptomyces scabiei (strain 87.22) TaxID=680198 RepID=C9ZEN9_STRSW|nr:sigma-70 family RNA polymerase sigma factor [Streptomyces scabiei]MBP5934393.1 sigma-70 family RNA polymerase sigma factor [Streptomyces sp. LBUM 1479]KFG10029.1 sigma factor [Streptomyces scabiei]MDX2536403.1 sigma-70 family RNA polymerase sigma factor [Streptomyces scabiei]MDX2576860.1 sigma-70 family RNA polymerase sigma factor [Streptomyces scabiei]MDX2656884.1 sigma-70 family RNA polymerase sigma factor [Streptomyces scabiei]